MRQLLLSLGVLFGIVSPQPDPELSVRLHRDAGALYMNAEIQNALGPAALAAVAAGNRMALEVRVQVGSATPLAFVNEIDYDPIAKLFSVIDAESGARHVTADPDAAKEIFDRYFGLRLLSLGEAAFPLTVVVTARLLLPDSPDLDAGPLWNYREPRIDRAFPSATAVPR